MTKLMLLKILNFNTIDKTFNCRAKKRWFFKITYYNL